MWSSPPAMNSSGARDVVLVVDPGLLVAGFEVGDQPVRPHPVAGCGDVVALVDGVRVLAAERVGERVVELLGREAHRPAPVGRVLEDREQRLDLRRRAHAHALGRGRVDHDARGAAAAVEQQLGERAAEGVPDQDRRLFELVDHAGQVRDGLRDGELGDDRRVLAQRLDLHLEAGVAGREDAVALGLQIRDPAFPRARGHPQPVDEDDGIGAHAVTRAGGPSPQSLKQICAPSRAVAKLITFPLVRCLG